MRGLGRAGEPFRHIPYHGFDYSPIIFAESPPGDQTLHRIFEHHHLAVGVNYSRVILINKELFEPEALELVINHGLDLFINFSLIETT